MLNGWLFATCIFEYGFRECLTELRRVLILGESRECVIFKVDDESCWLMIGFKGIVFVVGLISLKSFCTIGEIGIVLCASNDLN